MALDYKSRPTNGASTDAGCRELVRRIALHALRLLMAAGVACGGPGPRGVERETRAIDDRLTAGDYQVALRLATDLHERAARRYGSESMDLARVEDRLVPALVKNGRGGTAEALRVAEHAMGVEEAALGRDHVETTRAMHNLAPGSTGSRRVQRRTRFAHACARDPAPGAGRQQERGGQPRPGGAIPDSPEALRRG